MNNNRTFRTKIVAHQNPDHGWSWVIAISCCCINAIIFGIYRSYGVLFVALLQTYNVSRETAAWPFSLCLTVFHMTGLVSGALSNHFSTRAICISGCLIAATGITLCYFSTSVVQVMILIGVVKGFGIGLIGTQTPVIINQYFNKYRATASGIALAGGTIGSFIFPPLARLIIFEYSLRGCFLILGGIILHTIPIALLLRPPTPAPKGSKSSSTIDSEKGNMSLNIPSSNCDVDQATTKSSTAESVSSDENENLDEKTLRQVEHTILNNENTIFDKKSTDIISDEKKMINQTIDQKPDVQESTPAQKSKDEPEAQSSFLEKFVSALKTNATLINSLIRNPLFVILCSTQISFTWGWTTYVMVIVDFAVDKGVGISEAVVLLSAFAGADLCGRLGSGWISDKGIVRRRNVACVSILLIGVLLWTVPQASTFPVLLCISVGLGLFSGSIMILFSILLVEYVGIETMPVALGSSTFACGIATILRPAVIGYFRDVQGSYDGLFRTLGFACMSTALLWLAEPCFRIWQENRGSLYRFVKHPKPII